MTTGWTSDRPMNLVVWGRLWWWPSQVQTQVPCHWFVLVTKRRRLKMRQRCHLHRTTMAQVCWHRTCCSFISINFHLYRATRLQKNRTSTNALECYLTTEKSGYHLIAVSARIPYPLLLNISFKWRVQSLNDNMIKWITFGFCLTLILKIRSTDVCQSIRPCYHKIQVNRTSVCSLFWFELTTQIQKSLGP